MYVKEVALCIGASYVKYEKLSTYYRMVLMSMTTHMPMTTHDAQFMITFMSKEPLKIKLLSQNDY